ncbi:hypothetical protein B0T19DRAFT_154612 [Cercophora scortea]|uniref:Uncharacterized protein n=1 Tax=Cercophora scortea TaxID=314031 RepID=A0AAE0ILB3_9PEZI|nr:hypothetical protein B0T19DRAFT_154612 [Cercophora scortea]
MSWLVWGNFFTLARGFYPSPTIAIGGGALPALLLCSGTTGGSMTKKAPYFFPADYYLACIYLAISNILYTMHYMTYSRARGGSRHTRANISSLVKILAKREFSGDAWLAIDTSGGICETSHFFPPRLFGDTHSVSDERTEPVFEVFCFGAEVLTPAWV